ncbi:histidine kinase [Nostoc sp.]
MGSPLGIRGNGEWGSEGVRKINQYPMPNAPCPMPHAPCPIPLT